ncbi:MAG: ureidoglycolate lyase [Kiritimatiellales bacterium]
MKKLHVEELTASAFRPFGQFAKLIEPDSECIGAPPIEFFRDAIQGDFGGDTLPSFSTCRVLPREAVVDVTEYHSRCCEAVLPLDGDVLMHVMPAVPNGDRPPVDAARIFSVPKGTLCILRPGVWHHAPYAIGDQAVNVLIVLPERTYANDCVVVELTKEEVCLVVVE